MWIKGQIVFFVFATCRKNSRNNHIFAAVHHKFNYRQECLFNDFFFDIALEYNRITQIKQFFFIVKHL